MDAYFLQPARPRRRIRHAFAGVRGSQLAGGMACGEMRLATQLRPLVNPIAISDTGG